MSTQNIPNLNAQLARLKSGLTRAVLLRGLGLTTLCVLAWLVFAYFADWGLRVPRILRLLHGVVAVGLLGFALWRFVLQPLSKLPGRTGLALLLERSHGKAGELFVSAVEFADGTSNGDPALVQRVIQEAEARASELNPRSVINDARPNWLAAGGVVALLAVGAWSMSFSELASTFAQRLIGSDLPWPQRTTLVIRIPNLGDGASVQRDGGRITVRIARGLDLPVLIEAQGVIPASIKLHVEGDHDLVLSTHSGGVFRTLLPSLQTDQRFYATGGDDNDERPEVLVHVLEPPEVLQIALEVTPPAYSGLAVERFFDVDELEVLRGSQVSVWIRTTPNATAVITQLPDDQPIAFATAAWPEELESPTDALQFELTLDESLGFRVDLNDGEGLTSPDPPLIRLSAVDDHAPEITVLSPATSEIVIVAGGALPLRVRAEDDFHVEQLTVVVRPLGGDGEAPPVQELELVIRDLEVERSRTRHAVLAGQRLEVDAWKTADTAVVVGQRYSIEIFARDNRQPESNQGISLVRRARVVTAEELLRRLQDRLAQAKLAASRLDELQRDHRQRVEDLLDALEGSDLLATADSLAVTALVSGERRVAVGAIDLGRDLAAVTEDVLYARIDDKAENLLTRYDAALSEWPNTQFPDAIWRDLARRRRDSNGPSKGFASNLLELVDLSLEIGNDLAGSATNALEQAAAATRAVDCQAALELASERMTITSERLSDLLERLAEWDNFQNILTLTRDIVNRQKGLKERLQNFAKERK